MKEALHAVDVATGGGTELDPRVQQRVDGPHGVVGGAIGTQGDQRVVDVCQDELDHGPSRVLGLGQAPRFDREKDGGASAGGFGHTARGFAALLGIKLSQGEAYTGNNLFHTNMRCFLHGSGMAWLRGT